MKKKKTSSKKVNLYISQEINLAKHKLPRGRALAHGMVALLLSGC